MLSTPPLEEKTYTVLNRCTKLKFSEKVSLLQDFLKFSLQGLFNRQENVVGSDLLCEKVIINLWCIQTAQGKSRLPYMWKTQQWYVCVLCRSGEYFGLIDCGI